MQLNEVVPSSKRRMKLLPEASKLKCVGKKVSFFVGKKKSFSLIVCLLTLIKTFYYYTYKMATECSLILCKFSNLAAIDFSYTLL